MALKGKQALFVEEYLKTFNATEAAKAAGYSPKTAYSIGWENLRKPEISQAISRRLSESAMTSDEVLMRQAEIARSDIGEFLEQAEDGEVSVRLTDAKTKAPKRTHLIKRITQRKVVRTVKDMTETETTLTLELHDAQAAQVQLGKHHKLWTERTELTGPNGGPIKTEQVNAPDLSKLTIDELRSLREMMSKAHDPADARSG